MRAIFSRGAVVSVALLALVGCPEEEEEDPTPVKKPVASATVKTAAPAATSATKLVPASNDGDKKKKPAIEAKAKAELDGKAPAAGAKGITLKAVGGSGSFRAPSTWKNRPSGVWGVVHSADEKSRFAAGGLNEGEDAAAKRDAASTALGLENCDWSTPEAIKIGKDKKDAKVADGVCLREGKPVRAAYATVADMKTISLGSWDVEGGDGAAVFEVFRTVNKAAKGDASGIAACCSALMQNAKSAPLGQQGVYIAAAGACNAVRNSPQGRAALAGVRGMMAGAKLPAACR